MRQCLLVSGWLISSGVSMATEPPEVPALETSPTDPPSLKIQPTGKAPAEEASIDVIRGALDGGTEPPPADAILGGIVELIKGRGSVVDGSVLDPANDLKAIGVANAEDAVSEPSDDLQPVPSPSFDDGPPLYDWTPNAGRGQAAVNQQAALRVETAELLLDVARRLEFLGDGGSADTAMIRSMRRRAGQLLLK